MTLPAGRLPAYPPCQAIRDRFGVSATLYYQRLGQLIDTAAALRADPVTVKPATGRLREQRRVA